MSLFSYLMGRDGAPIQHTHATKAAELQIDLTNPLEDEPLDFGTLREVLAVTVVSMTGTATLKINGAGECPVSLASGQVRDNLDARELHLSAPGTGGTLILELHGR